MADLVQEFHEPMQAAIRHLEAEEWPKAESILRTLLERFPLHDDTMQLLGLSLFRQGHVADAEHLLREAIRINPQSLRARNNLGAMLKDLGRLEEASAEFQQLYLLAPHDAHACANLATVLIELGNHEEGLRFSSEAIALTPRWGHAHMVHGLAQKNCGDMQGARASLEHALTLESNNPEFNSNFSSLLIELKDYETAEHAARKALAVAPDRSDAHHNLGVALARQFIEQEAMEHLERAIALDPHNAKAHCDLASLVCDQGDLDRALSLYRQAMELAPHLGLARFGLGIIQLTKGDFINGWTNYEARKITPELHAPVSRPIAQPWQGENLHDKKLFLFGEQGFGDVVQFVRFIPRLLELGARIGLDIQPELARLVSDSDWPIDLLSRTEAEHESFDFECSLLSVPMMLGTTLADLPVACNYLRSNPGKRNYWKEKLATCPRPWIGLCWAGNPGHKNDHNRSIEAGLFSQICTNIGASFISMQRDCYDYELAEFAERGAPLINWTDEFFNFAETAALLDNLDLVISVDTVVAHLAGSLGKSCWTLIPHVPDWRWLERREDSPWYPNMRLFRQPAREDWESVIAQASDSLADWMNDFKA